MDMLKKLNWRWLMMLAAVMRLGAAMTACGDDDDDDDNDGNTSRYIGVWADADELYDPDYSGGVYAVELRGDGTGRDGQWYESSNEFRGDDYIWEWRVDGNLIYITESDGDVNIQPFTISDDGRSGTIGGEPYVKVK